MLTNCLHTVQELAVWSSVGNSDSMKLGQWTNPMCIILSNCPYTVHEPAVFECGARFLQFWMIYADASKQKCLKRVDLILKQQQQIFLMLMQNACLDLSSAKCIIAGRLTNLNCNESWDCHGSFIIFLSCLVRGREDCILVISIRTIGSYIHVIWFDSYNWSL